MLDACTLEGIAALGFAENFPYGVAWPSCQAIARDAHTTDLAGIAARSNTEATRTASVGEELALFEEVAVGAVTGPATIRRLVSRPDPGAG